MDRLRGAGRLNLEKFNGVCLFGDAKNVPTTLASGGILAVLSSVPESLQVGAAQQSCVSHVLYPDEN